MSDAADKVKDFMAEVNKTYKAGVIEIGNKFKSLNIARFSTGVLSADLALGGGWPFNRIAIIAGEYSTGKTLMAIKACNSVTEYDHTTKAHKDFVKPENFIPGRALFVDVEGTFDIDWAVANGFDEEYHAVARPDYGEQAIDIITSAIDKNVFDLIVLDSIASLSPTKEIEDSSEDQQMGVAARMNNKAFRKWNAKLNKIAQDSVRGGPLLLCLNQFRMKIGFVMRDPRTLPGGKGQGFCSSILIYMKSAKYSDGKEKELAEVDLSGTVHKNKTYIPRQNFEFGLALKDDGEIAKGTILNEKELLKMGKKYGLIVVHSPRKVTFGKHEFKTQTELMAKVKASPTLYRSLWRSVVKAANGIVV